MYIIEKILEFLDLSQKDEISKSSFVTLLATVAFTWWFGRSNLFPLILMQVITFSLGVLAVVITKKCLNGYKLQLAVSSGVTIALLLAFEGWKCGGNLRMATDSCEILLSWWGQFLYFPLLLSMIKFIGTSIRGAIDHKAMANYYKNNPHSTPYSDVDSAKHSILCVRDIILCIAMPIVIIFFFYYGMCSLMIVRAVAELLNILTLVSLRDHS